MRRARRLRCAALALLAVAAVSRAARAQVASDERWSTITTQHFRIHFTSATAGLARRAALNAEQAYANLASELVPPRGPIDLVLADNVDFSNGYAGPFPSNRIVVYAQPPVAPSALESYVDWNALVILHELAHIFELDRTRGLWRLGQTLFGRNPALFPNNFAPAWLTEGLAVYYESRFTGSGRLEGSAGYALAHAAALDRRLPRVDQLSLASTRFPGGDAAYAYGALLVDYVARSAGPGSVRDMVERASGSFMPFSLPRVAKHSFGLTFEQASRRWRDSLGALAGTDPRDAASRRKLTRAGRLVQFPRWLSDTALVYAADNGRDTPGAYRVALDGQITRLGRRNSLDANDPAGGAIVFAQQDLLDRFRVRSDLYATDRAGTRRLTRGARLLQPDARDDGSIVAVQSAGATTRLVVASASGDSIVRLTTGGGDTVWTSPRWSPRGGDGRYRVAAVARSRGVSLLVLLDDAGAGATVVARTRASLRTPSWSPAGDKLYFSSDAGGRTRIYAAAADPADSSVARGSTAAAVRLLEDDPVGIFDPEPQPGGALLATSVLRADGYHLGVARVVDGRPASLAASASPRAGCTGCVVPPAALPALDTAALASRAYTPWATLIPRYWSPLVTAAAGSGTLVGGLTSGVDVIGRHSYGAQALLNTVNRNVDAVVAYRYGKLRSAVIDASTQQAWSYPVVLTRAGQRFGELQRRTRLLAMSATLVRPRVRTYASASLGAELEWRDESSSSAAILDALPASHVLRARYPALVASARFSNVQRPTLSISPEDGVTVGATVRERWGSEVAAGPSASVVGVGSAYRSLELPGFAHHVIAARVAGGYADARSPSVFSLGGVSGGSVELLPGFSSGSGARTFPVRGFRPGAEEGTRALAASVEYRAPLSAPSRGVRVLPVFLDRTSVAIFTDVGRAYCPRGTVLACESRVGGGWLASVGAELDLDAALQFDVPYRVRLGVAVPTLGGGVYRSGGATFYAAVGSAF